MERLSVDTGPWVWNGPSCLLLPSPPQTLSHNGPSCMNEQQLKPQHQLQHPPQPQHSHRQTPLHHPQTQPLQHPQSHSPMMGPSCSLAARHSLSTSQCGSVITQASSTLTHSGWVRVWVQIHTYISCLVYPSVHILFRTQHVLLFLHYLFLSFTLSQQFCAMSCNLFWHRLALSPVKLITALMN